MNIQTGDLYFCGGSVKVFEFDLTHRTAVGSVGVLSTKSIHIKSIGTPANFLVGSKGNAKRRMGDMGGQQIFGGCQNLSNAGLVICTKQCCAVSNDQMLSNMVMQAWIVFFPKPDIFFLIQADVAPFIQHGLCMDVSTGGIGGGIHVGNQADGGKRRIAGYGTVYIAIFIHICVPDAQFLHFFDQSHAKDLLLIGRGAGF